MKLIANGNNIRDLAFGDTDDIDHVILGDNVGHRNLLFKEIVAELDLFSDGFSTVDLDLSLQKKVRLPQKLI